MDKSGISALSRVFSVDHVSTIMDEVFKDLSILEVKGLEDKSLDYDFNDYDFNDHDSNVIHSL